MRLIDADALMEKLNVFNDREHGNEHFLYGIETAKELLEDTPTTTEAEIRAMAIDEFAKKLKGRFAFSDILYNDQVISEVNRLAEQMKEE